MKTRNKNINIPNALSILRILLIPLFIYYFLNKQIWQAAIVLILSGLSDLLDGKIARKFNQFTELGQMLDPLADKLTQGSVAVCLAIEQPMLIPLLAIFVVKEVSMITAGCFLINKKKRPCGAKWYGKVATTLFYISVTIIVVMQYFKHDNKIVTITLLSITAGFMIYAFIKYVQIFVRILHSDDPSDRIDLELTNKKPKNPNANHSV